MYDQIQAEPAPELDSRVVNAAVGRRIKAVRVMHGHSQEMLGRMLGLTFQQVQKYERGSNKISSDKLWRIARYYGVPLEFFFQDLAPGRPTGDAAKAPHERLRLEIGREAQHVPAGILRAILDLMRATLAPAEPEPAPLAAPEGD